MNKQSGRRLVLLEASKVRSQHSTLIDGILRASLHGNLDTHQAPPLLLAHTTLFDHMSDATKRGIEFRSVSVMDPQRRRLIRKSLVEVYVTFRALLALKTDKEFLLVTTILPSAAIVVEMLKWLFPHKQMAIMIHGDVEGILDKSRQRVDSYGLYMKIWFGMRRRSTLKLAVIDRFIADMALGAFPNAIRADELFVIPLLVEPATLQTRPEGPVKCCFIGFDTPNKGYFRFESLASQFPQLEFVKIGGGVLKNERTGIVTTLRNNSDFLDEISKCDIAVFPYTGGYSCSLSAAAIDAVSAGAHIFATERGCFLALAEEFGADCVTIFQTPEDMSLVLGCHKTLKQIRLNKPKRLGLLETSRYGLASVAQSVKDMLQGVTFKSSNRSAKGLES